MLSLYMAAMSANTKTKRTIESSPERTQTKECEIASVIVYSQRLKAEVEMNLCAGSEYQGRVNVIFAAVIQTLCWYRVPIFEEYRRAGLDLASSAGAP